LLGPEVDVASGQEILQNGARYFLVFRHSGEMPSSASRIPAAFHGSSSGFSCVVATHGDRLVFSVGDAFESADRSIITSIVSCWRFYSSGGGGDVAERLPWRRAS